MSPAQIHLSEAVAAKRYHLKINCFDLICPWHYQILCIIQSRLNKFQVKKNATIEIEHWFHRYMRQTLHCYDYVFSICECCCRLFIHSNSWHVHYQAVHLNLANRTLWVFTSFLTLRWLERVMSKVVSFRLFV